MPVGRAARPRAQPHIEALRLDLNRMLAEARDGHQSLLSVCASHDPALPALQRLCTLLAGAPWSEVLAQQPGHRAAASPGQVILMTKALPWWRYGKAWSRACPPAPALASNTPAGA